MGCKNCTFYFPSLNCRFLFWKEVQLLDNHLQHVYSCFYTLLVNICAENKVYLSPFSLAGLNLLGLYFRFFKGEPGVGCPVRRDPSGLSAECQQGTHSLHLVKVRSSLLLFPQPCLTCGIAVLLSNQSS